MSNDTRSASQRIEDLEKASVSLYQALEAFSKDFNLAKETLKLLSNKVDAIVKVAAAGSVISDDSVTKQMVQNNVLDLKEKVKGLLDGGTLSAQESVDDTSFIVARELDDQGNEINPRLQFALGALSDQILKDKIKGAKAGDILQLQEGKLQLQVMEIYSINVPQAENASAPIPAPSPVQSPEASAASEPSTENSPESAPEVDTSVSDAIPSEAPDASADAPNAAQNDAAAQ